MQQLQYFTILCMAVLMLACTPSKEKLQKNIQEAESALFNQKDVSINEKSAEPLIAAYEKFAEAYPKDSAAPEYLFKLADVYRGIKQADKSFAVYDKIIATYPNYEKTPTCLFLKGFLYENEKQNLKKAAAMYQQFLKQYPQHELADDVSFSLNNLGKSPEELIKQFEQMQQDSSLEKSNNL
jgi:tetratricopeptide (TPR) repeat protein